MDVNVVLALLMNVPDKCGFQPMYLNNYNSHVEINTVTTQL